MLNIIKNSFISFYKNLPILIPVGLTVQIFSFYFPIETYPISTIIVFGLYTLVIMILLSERKDITQYKHWKFWCYYISCYIIIKLINIGTMKLFSNILIQKIISPISFLYTPITYIILELTTISYINFLLGIILCSIVNGDRPNIKNIIKIISFPYWKIILLSAIIDIPVTLTLLATEGNKILILLTWYSSCIFLSFIANFYKAQKAGDI